MPDNEAPPRTGDRSLNKKAWYQNERLTAALEFAQKMIVILGVPVAIYTYANERAKERDANEWTTYEKMDDRYWMYERLAMDYPQLNVSDAGASDPELAKLTKPRDKLTAQERIHERQLMFMLIAMYERAYILYSNKSSEFRARQWAGWDNGLKRWVKTGAFREAWKQLGEDFDAQYQDYVNKLLKIP